MAAIVGSAKFDQTNMSDLLVNYRKGSERHEPDESTRLHTIFLESSATPLACFRRVSALIDCVTLRNLAHEIQYS